MLMLAPHPLVVSIDDGYSSYDQELALLDEIGARFEVRPCKGDEQKVVEAVEGADVVLVRESPVTRKVMEAADRCKGVIRYGIGLDNIDLAAARERHIAVANVPDYGVEEVSTHAVALLLAVVRQLMPRDEQVRSGRWTSAPSRPMYRLRGRTLGLIGYGRIARQVHEKLSGFGFSQVLVYDPSADIPASFKSVEIEEICRHSDVISLHAPLNSQTKHLINADRLAMMRPTTIIVNTARGGLIDANALTDALRDGHILGAGLDVFESEPPDSSHPIFKLQNVVISDHIGWYSEESMRELQRKATLEAIQILSGTPPKNWVNKW